MAAHEAIVTAGGALRAQLGRDLETRGVGDRRWQTRRLQGRFLGNFPAQDGEGRGDEAKPARRESPARADEEQDACRTSEARREKTTMQQLSSQATGSQKCSDDGGGRRFKRARSRQDRNARSVRRPSSRADGRHLRAADDRGCAGVAEAGTVWRGRGKEADA